MDQAERGEVQIGRSQLKELELVLLVELGAGCDFKASGGALGEEIGELGGLAGSSAAGGLKKTDASARAARAWRVRAPRKSDCHLERRAELARSVSSRAASCSATLASFWPWRVPSS